MKKLLAVLVLSLIVVGCTSTDVRPISPEHDITSISIIENPEVAVEDFVDVLIDGFARHNIRARLIRREEETKDEYVVTYVAFRKWDMAPYLTDASIRIERNGEIIASARYYLKGGGGLALNKWKSTRSKMDPVIDDLLQNF